MDEIVNDNKEVMTMFYIEIDRVLLEIGIGKSELYNLELFGPDKYKIIVISNPNTEEEAKLVKEKLLDEYESYHKYTFEILTTENMPRGEVRLTLTEKNPQVSQVYMPYVPVTPVTVDEYPLQTLRCNPFDPRVQKVKLTTVEDMFKASLSLLEPKTIAKFNTKSK